MESAAARRSSAEHGQTRPRCSWNSMNQAAWLAGSSLGIRSRVRGGALPCCTGRKRKSLDPVDHPTAILYRVSLSCHLVVGSR